MPKKKRIRLRGEPLVIPKLAVPKRIRSRRQYVRWTKLCRDWLVKYHRYPADSFIRIANTEPPLGWTQRYPFHWQTHWNWGYPKARPRWSGLLDKVPRGAATYWPEGLDICSEAFDPRCPLDMLEEIQHWMDYRYEDDLEGLCGCCGGDGHLRLAPVSDSLSGDSTSRSRSHAFGVAEEV